MHCYLHALPSFPFMQKMLNKKERLVLKKLNFVPVNHDCPNPYHCEHKKKLKKINLPSICAIELWTTGKQKEAAACVSRLEVPMTLSSEVLKFSDSRQLRLRPWQPRGPREAPEPTESGQLSEPREDIARDDRGGWQRCVSCDIMTRLMWSSDTPMARIREESQSQSCSGQSCRPRQSLSGKVRAESFPEPGLCTCCVIQSCGDIVYYMQCQNQDSFENMACRVSVSWVHNSCISKVFCII